MASGKNTGKKTALPYMIWGIAAVLLLAAAAAVWAASSEETEESLNQSEETKPAEETGTTEEQSISEGQTPLEESEEPEEPAEALEARQEKPEKQDPVDATRYPEEISLPSEPAVINGVLLANKQHPLPADYAPGEDPAARAAFTEMAEAARAEGFELVAFSTYRSFERQKELYNGYVAKDGQEAADRYSARPGFSEHQTGLAFDIGEQGREEHWASASFGETEAGKWLAAHAPDYGFILRYPEGAEQLTGYMHESWHFRYVGKEAAQEIHDQDLTLEQYLGVQPK